MKKDRLTRRRFVRKVAAGTVLAFGMGLTTQRMYASYDDGSGGGDLDGSGTSLTISDNSCW